MESRNTGELKDGFVDVMVGGQEPSEANNQVGILEEEEKKNEPGEQ